MSYLSETMLKTLDPKKGEKCLDLTCGTGFVTNTLYQMTHGAVTGIDASEGMITVARQKYGDTCQFHCDDAFTFLQNQPSHSYDCITCAWGFGYLSPHILKEIFRTLRKHGKIGIIDNSMFSNWEFIWCFLAAVAEEPDALNTLIRPHFFLSTQTLIERMRWNGFTIKKSWMGKKTLHCKTKEAAMEQLINSGVSAGILQGINETHKEKIIKRIGELLQNHHSKTKDIPITHRYIAAVGEKKK
jgi:ubiquinone/menaquinone biosynthesis C-methylase UbiE